MAVVKIKDGDGNQIFLEAVGAGTSGDPFRMLNANNLSERVQGNIPGETTVFITGNNPNIGTSFVDMNDHGSVVGFASASESIEILSSDVNDSEAGTGVRTILVTTLDVNGVEQANIVSMNGTTPVAIPGTHRFYRSIITVTADPAGTRTNIGTITLRVAGGGATRLQIQPTWGSSFSGLFTVPKGKKFIPTTVAFFVQKGEDVIIRPRVFGSTADGAIISSGPAPLYQNSTFVTIMATSPIPALSSIFFQAVSTNVGVNATVVLEGDLIDV